MKSIKRIFNKLLIKKTIINHGIHYVTTIVLDIIDWIPTNLSNTCRKKCIEYNKYFFIDKRLYRIISYLRTTNKLIICYSYGILYIFFIILLLFHIPFFFSFSFYLILILILILHYQLDDNEILSFSIILLLSFYYSPSFIVFYPFSLSSSSFSSFSYHILIILHLLIPFPSLFSFFFYYLFHYDIYLFHCDSCNFVILLFCSSFLFSSITRRTPISNPLYYPHIILSFYFSFINSSSSSSLSIPSFLSNFSPIFSPISFSFFFWSKK